MEESKTDFERRNVELQNSVSQLRREAKEDLNQANVQVDQQRNLKEAVTAEKAVLNEQNLATRNEIEGLKRQVFVAQEMARTVAQDKDRGEGWRLRICWSLSLIHCFSALRLQNKIRPD